MKQGGALRRGRCLGPQPEGLRLGRGAVLTPPIAQETQGTFPFVWHHQGAY